MKIQIFSVTFAISSISSLLINLTTTHSTNAQTANQINTLRSKGVPVVLPGSVPSGFRLTSFEITGLRGVNSRWTNYDATYRGPNNCEFSVGGSDGGWGAPGPVRQWDVITPLFGKVILEEFQGAQGRPNSLNSAALPISKGVLPGFPKAGYVFNFSCKLSIFSHQQASQILKSMRIVK